MTIIYNYVDIYKYVEQLNVENGETLRMTCPMCKSYKTFSVTNNMGSLLWNCYKASCDVKGGSRVRLSVDDIKGIKQKKSQVVTSFTMPEYIVPHTHEDCTGLKDWCNKWGLDYSALDLHYDIKESRVVFL